MDWVAIISAICGSTALSAIITAFINRKDKAQNREFNYQDHLEQRMEKLERRLDKFEVRDSIFSSATACANACQNADGCPVLTYLHDHPIPEK